MPVSFSQRPGRHERHYRRRVENALFPRSATRTDDDLLEAQRLDHEELLAFLTELRGAVKAAVELRPNVESQVILDLKGQLDKLYEQASGLADRQEDNKTAIRQLLDVITKTVRDSADNDPQASAELEQERVARETHFELLESPLVADILHPASVIAQEELLAVLLGAESSDLAAALNLFDAQQIQSLVDEGQALLQDKDPDQSLTQAWQSLDQLHERLDHIGTGDESASEQASSCPTIQ